MSDLRLVGFGVALSVLGYATSIALGVDLSMREECARTNVERWFVPVSAEDGAWMLAAIALGGLALAAIVFQRREYREAGER